MLKTARITANGFTMVELLIVVSIIAIMTGALIPSFSAYTKNQALRQAQEQIVNDLYNVQNNSLSGKKNFDGAQTKFWGLRFDGDGTYEYITANVSTNCTGGGVIAEREQTLPENIIAYGTGSPDCVFFANKNGDTDSVETIRVRSDTGSGCYIVTLNEFGLISRVREFQSTCP